MSKDSIRLHPEFGVNPSLDLCFWCGEAKGVALLGYNKGEEAPKEVVLDYQPCDKCVEQFSQGILFAEADLAYNLKRPPINPKGSPELAPTGRYVVVNRDAVQHIVTDPQMLEATLKNGKCFIEPTAFTLQFGEYLNDEKEN